MSEPIHPYGCPHCGSNEIVPIVYGYPGPELVERWERGEVELGGCCISFDDPTERCRACGAELGRPSEGGAR